MSAPVSTTRDVADFLALAKAKPPRARLRGWRRFWFWFFMLSGPHGWLIALIIYRRRP